MDLRDYLIDMARDARQKAAETDDPALRATLHDLADYCDDEVARLNLEDQEQRVAS
ncbi:hypothetical protein SAMN05216382_0936 [Sphingomonas palmae]|uniref:Uncharacterized protein n=1 Tax=Sphingomonas palmae TaxID=1855283 RepID=A0A1H7J6B9_9SPHN|nr:hypothetical protein [Sphingomonas palmae]SEK69417.1 hypothetical protein SAMN05216382_0936 [Sphingomonas palmae]